MPGLIGGGGSSNQVQYVPYNAGGTGQGGTVYTPSAQPQADTTYQALLNNLYGMYTSGTTPPQQNYPLAENAALNIAQNQFGQQQLQGAQTISPLLENIGLNSINLGTGYENLLPQITGLGDTLSSLVPQETGLANQLSVNIPQVSNLANEVAGYIPGVAALGGQVAGYMPQVASLSPQVTVGIAPLQQGAQNLLQTGYDPQNALYMQLAQKAQQQSAGANALAGLGSSPYGAGLTADALNNMNINWENQQLARQAQALQGAGQAYGQAGQLGTEGANILGLAGNLGGQAANIYGQAGRLGDEASNIWGRVGALGTEAGSLLGQAGQLGTGAANIYSSVPGVASGLLNLGTGGANAFMGGAGLPYQTSVGQSQAALPALTSATNLGISQYQLPQQVLNDLQSYLRLGQSASDLSGVLGNLGYNQGQQTLGNIGGALGMADPLLFGSQGLTGALGLNPQTGLFGGGGGGVLGGLFGGGSGAATLANPFNSLDALGGAGVADLFSAGAGGFSPLDLGLLFA